MKHWLWSIMRSCVVSCMVALLTVKADTDTNTCVRACIIGSDGSLTSCTDWLDRITSAKTTDQNIVTSSATEGVFSNASRASTTNVLSNAPSSTTTIVESDTPTFSTTNEYSNEVQTQTSTPFSSAVSNAETSTTGGITTKNPTNTTISSATAVVRSSLTSTARSATTVSTDLPGYNFLYGLEYGDSNIADGDDYCEYVPNSYHNLFVCTNGIVSLNGSYTAFTPSILKDEIGLSLVAPYYMDIDLTYGGGVVYYHLYDANLHGSISNESNVRTAEALIKRLSGRRYFTTLYLLIVTWDKVLQYPAEQQDPSQSASFQLVLVSDGVNIYAVYKYFPGQMRFSGNYDAFIGYLLRPDIYVQHSISFTTEALRIDQNVATQGIQGMLFYQLTGERSYAIKGIQRTLFYQLTDKRSDTTNEEAFDYGTEIGDKMFGDVDDRCVNVQNTYTFPVFSTLQSDIYVCSNGIVTIDGSHISPDLPRDLNSVEFDILMPYYTDIELKNNGVVYYQVTDVTKDDQFRERENVIKAELYVRGLKTNIRYFEAQFLLVVTWYRVTPYPADIRSNETMSFQLVLVSDGYETYVLYIYFENEMNLQENNAVIGYMTRPGRFVQHLYSTTPLSRNISSLLRARDRRGAIFYELTEFPNEDNVYRHKCIKWYARNNAGRVIFNRSMSEMPDCPCTLDFLQRDRRFTGLQFSQGDARCSYMRPSWQFRPLGVGKTCCYHEFSDQYFVQTGPYAGGFIRYNPWFSNTWHVREDLEMRGYCCDKTDLCHLYRALRPTGNCYTTFPVRFANFWGNGHIDTFDGRKYTFNGYGEYTLLTLNSGSTTFVLQARTSRAEKVNGNFSDATIFSAFATKDDRGVQTHVELNSTKTGLLIFAKTGSSETFDDYTLSFASEATSFAVDTENGSFFRENNRTAFTAHFSSGIFMTITQRRKMLSISVGMPSIFRGQTRGLLGNFDGDITNDFICANGTQLDNTITDREIFQFGQSWTINGPDSVFRYSNGKHSADYSHQDFTPKFMDEADSAMVANATSVCGEENQECIFDLVFTENEEVANETLHIERESKEERRQITNVVPHIKGPSIVEATMNATVTYTISGMDDDMIGYRFLKNDIGATLQLNESCGAFVSFTMSVDIPIELRVIAEDNNGVVSNLYEPTIVFCSGCNNHGICDFTTYKDDNQTTITFKYARCICNQYWSGSECDEDFDSCADSPCSALRTCTDYPPALHEQLRIGYNCSDCPGGYSLGGDGKCADIDECSTMNGGCEQICENIHGSYTCSCFSTFRILSNGKTCKDIDECEESLSDCDQICLNTNGSYNCSCFQGFEYNAISRICLAGELPSVCSHLNCSNSTGCTIDGIGNATCFCRIGYHLSSDGSFCEDDDECIQNTCQQICTNTPGSFQCTCYAGFQMDNDKLTCKPCQPLMFGENCSQVCECSQGAERCDPVRGCICRAGWTGSTCESDVDECRDPNICRGVLKSCVNTNGSYACTCVDGYTLKESNVCSDVDECNDPDLDVCEQECVNTAGGFYCICEDGFIIDPQNNTKCKDINECTNGQSGCQHICENTPGRFICDCYYGYRLASDRKTCEQVENPCATLGNFNCSQICVVTDDSSFCSCNYGYQLMEDSLSCIDINECSAESLNQCSHTNRCLNNEGGYTCSCDIGFRLDKDGRTCHDCDALHYGPDCSIPCSCGVGAVMCHPVTGCVCKNGWRGEKCTVDRNECNSIPSPCTGANAICINTNGSYICACVPGFRNTSNGCEDINECEDPLLNECEQICVNKEGNYTCDCKPGFLEDQHNCYDINECAGQNNCSHSCENTHGGYRCACDDGFKLNLADERTCIQITIPTIMTFTQQEHLTTSPFETSPTQEPNITASTAYFTHAPSVITSFPTAIIPTETPITIMRTETASNRLNTTIRTTQEPVTTSAALQTTFTSSESTTTSPSRAITTTFESISSTTSSNQTTTSAPENTVSLSTIPNAESKTTATNAPTTFSSTTMTLAILVATNTSSATTTIQATPDPVIKSSTSATTTTHEPSYFTWTAATTTISELATTISTTTATTTTPESTTSSSTTTTTIIPEASTASSATSVTTTPESNTTSSTTASITTYKPILTSSTTAPRATPESTTISSTTASTTIGQPAATISTKKTTTILQPASTLLSTSTSMTTSEPSTILLTTSAIVKPEQTTTLPTIASTITPESTTTALTTASTVTGQSNTNTSTKRTMTTPHPTTILSSTSTTMTTSEETNIALTTGNTVIPVATTSSSTTLVSTTAPKFMPTSTLSTSATKPTTRLISLSSTRRTTKTLTSTSFSSTTKTRTTQESMFSSSTVNATTLEPTASTATGGINIITNRTMQETTTSVAASGTITTTPKMKNTTLNTGLTTTLDSTKTTSATETEVKTIQTSIYRTSTAANITAGACPGDSFGSNCENECRCKRENAVNPNTTCSPTNGTCICKSGWTGNCDEDIDECAVETNICHDKPNTGCYNIDGGYSCSCLIGFEENKNGVCVDAVGKETTNEPNIKAEQLGLHCSITFNIQISVSINLNVPETYSHYEYTVRVTLEVFFASFLMQSSAQVVITSLRRGSLIVDYVLIVENNEETKQQLAEAFEQLASGEPVSIDGKNATAKNLSFGNISITNGTLGLCFRYLEMYGRCPDSYECLVKNRIPTCRPKETLISDGPAVIIGLGIGIPVCFLIIAPVVLAVYLRKSKRKKSKYFGESEDKTCRFDLHRMTTRFKGRHRREDYFYYGQWPNYNGSHRMWNEC